MNTTTEMRVGMSAYWVVLMPDVDGKGWTARWEQNGVRKVSGYSTKILALRAAKSLAKRIESGEAPPCIVTAPNFQKLVELAERVTNSRARMIEISKEETSIGRNYPGAYGFADSTFEWIIRDLQSMAGGIK